MPSRRALLKYGLTVVVVCMGLAVALLLERYNSLVWQIRCSCLPLP